MRVCQMSVILGCVFVLMVWVGCGEEGIPPPGNGEAPPLASPPLQRNGGQALPAPLGAGVWVSLAPLNEPRQEVGVATLGGEVYVIGGLRRDRTVANTVEVYNPTANSWRMVQPLPVPLHHVGAVGVQNRVYVIGGFRGPFLAVNSVFAYDPANDNWKPMASLPTSRGALAVAAFEEQIYAVGGARQGQSVQDFAVYDLQSNQWSVLPLMPTPRDHLAAGIINGKLYAVGGRNQTSFTLGVLEGYDLATGTWTPKTLMPTPRSGIAGAVLQGRLHVFGGEGNSGSPRGVFEENEAYDPQTDVWQTFAPMPTPRHGTGTAVISDQIFIPGGGVKQGFGPSGVHEMFSF
ncbi:galactose oxidase [Candidatus Poribacteria bacterium]|nr:galactose oxidase [Candidatus Poribacteria bacterium]